VVRHLCRVWLDPVLVIRVADDSLGHRMEEFLEQHDSAGERTGGE
jgi:hypothetical protein